MLKIQTLSNVLDSGEAIDHEQSINGQFVCGVGGLVGSLVH